MGVWVRERQREKRGRWGDRKRERKAQVSGFLSSWKDQLLVFIRKEGERSRKGEKLFGNLSCWQLFLSLLSSLLILPLLTVSFVWTYTQMMPIYILLHVLSIDKVIRDGVYFFLYWWPCFFLQSHLSLFLWRFTDHILALTLQKADTHIQFSSFSC